ncbi:MAG: NAD(P)/FAD-dependent oxidoreductase [Burkholderiales bacterium]
MTAVLDDADVLVVGGGIIGLACAFRLARSGRSVHLISALGPGIGASFGNAGHVATEQVVPLANPQTIRRVLSLLWRNDSALRIHRSYIFNILPWLLRFARAAGDARLQSGIAALSSLQSHAAADFAALLEDAKVADLLHMDGHLVLIEEPRSRTRAAAELDELRRWGVDADWLDSSATQAVAPGLGVEVSGGFRYRGTGHVGDPYAVCQGLERAYRANGGIVTVDLIDSLSYSVNKFVATTRRGVSFRAKQMVLCAGAWSGRLARMLEYDIPVEAERGYHLTIPGAKPGFTIPVASYERSVIMTPMDMGLRMTGIVEFAGLDLPPAPSRTELLRKHLNALLPELGDNHATTWMGCRPSLPDHLPVIGRAEFHDDLYFAFGHQHLGLTLSGVTANGITALVNGDTPKADLTPFRASRF